MAAAVLTFPVAACGGPSTSAGSDTDSYQQGVEAAHGAALNAPEETTGAKCGYAFERYKTTNPHLDHDQFFKGCVDEMKKVRGNK